MGQEDLRAALAAHGSLQAEIVGLQDFNHALDSMRIGVPGHDLAVALLCDARSFRFMVEVILDYFQRIVVWAIGDQMRSGSEEGRRRALTGFCHHQASAPETL